MNTAVTHPPSLAYDQTVRRDLVHRWSLSEVFLTAYEEVDERRFACAAQLPLTHAYFRDHPAAEGVHDPLQVLETARQAVTYAAHVHQGVPLDTTFMVTGWLLDVTDPDALARTERPGELRVDGVVTDRRERGGHVRRLVFAMDLVLDGRPLGRASMDVSCTPTEQYHALRRMQRGADVPTAFTLPAEPVGMPVAPAEVGRLDPANAVLDDVRRGYRAVTAVLSPRTFRNRSMYDHPYDHVPAMVLSEAARQCAVLVSAKAGRLVRLEGRFDRFAELDEPVTLTAQPTPEPDSYRMLATQGESMVARIDVVLGRATEGSR